MPGTLDEADVSNTRAELIRPEDFATRPRIVGLALSLAAALREPLMKHRGGVELTSDCAANMLSVYAAGGRPVMSTTTVAPTIEGCTAPSTT